MYVDLSMFGHTHISVNSQEDQEQWDGVTDSCEPPDVGPGNWTELNLSPVQEQHVLLTAEPSLRPTALTLYIWFIFVFSWEHMGVGEWQISVIMFFLGFHFLCYEYLKTNS